GLFTAGLRHTDRQIPQRPAPGQGAPDTVQPLQSLHQPTSPEGLRPLRATGTGPWNGSGADGAGLRYPPAVCYQQYHWRDQHGPAEPQPDQHQYGTDGQGPGRDRGDSPQPAQPGTLRLGWGC